MMAELVGHVGSFRAIWQGAIQMKRPYPEHIFIGLILAGMLAGLVISATGLSEYWGFRIMLGTFAVAWLPALFVLVFIRIPEWWRGK
jgi:hypothetical protein